MPSVRRIQQKTWKNLEIGVAPETRRVNKFVGPIAPLLQVRACEGYGPANAAGRSALEEDQ